MSEIDRETELAKVQAEVAELKKYLTAQADTAFIFQPPLWKMIGKQDQLHFRKLTYPELLQHNLPFIPPRFTDKTWAKGEFEALPQEMQEWWRLPRDPTDEEGKQLRESRRTILSLTNLDGKTVEDFDLYGPIVMGECFEFVAKISGFSDDALELLDWFRQQQ